MRRLARLRPDHSEVGLKLSGLALAGASAIFALSMSMSPPSTPPIEGMEHFAIYARPARRPSAAQTAQANVDYTPVGSIGKGREALLSGYEILQATPEGVMLRLPEGRVTRVSRGGRIAGLGGVIAIEQRGRSWIIRTEAGVIR